MRRARRASGVIELLRLCVIVFAAGLGYEVGRAAYPQSDVLGPLSGVTVAVIIGSGVGYVLGGMLGRGTLSAVERAELTVREVPADTIVAGALGAVIGGILGAGVAVPLFLIPQPYIAFPLAGFAVVTLALTGYRIGLGRRDDLLRLFGARAGVRPRPLPAAAVPRVLDTSVAIDGRVVDVVRAGFLHGRFVVPAGVLGELHAFADSSDDSRRARGRRGLETLELLRREPGVELEVFDATADGVAGSGHPSSSGLSEAVDATLVRLCLDRGFALLTLDSNLAKVAALAGAAVLNLHALALALRPPVAAGDEIDVQLQKPGKETGQAVGYLDDGTMVVVERARPLLGREVRVKVASVLLTANGRLVFAETVPSAPVRRAAP